jgi:uridine phosphorylase
MFKRHFKAEHINAIEDDLIGNGDIGRYVLLPGSDGRAKNIAEHFDNLVVKQHQRAHNLYLGTLSCDGKMIDVATISSGMGCPSIEIILHELFQLGAKRFLRIGTGGSLQAERIKIGDIVNAQAAVRDEDTTTHYAPLEFPAIASLEFTSSIMLAAEKIGLANKLHTGIVHCKSSLYAREFSAGPRADENNAYINLLSRTGVLATEMESSALFIQSQIYNHQLLQKGNSPHHRVLAGAILAIVATPENHFDRSNKPEQAIQQGIQLALETVRTLASQEFIE